MKKSSEASSHPLSKAIVQNQTLTKSGEDMMEKYPNALLVGMSANRITTEDIRESPQKSENTPTARPSHRK